MLKVSEEHPGVMTHPVINIMLFPHEMLSWIFNWYNNEFAKNQLYNKLQCFSISNPRTKNGPRSLKQRMPARETFIAHDIGINSVCERNVFHLHPLRPPPPSSLPVKRGFNLRETATLEVLRGIDSDRANFFSSFLEGAAPSTQNVWGGLES